MERELMQASFGDREVPELLLSLCDFDEDAPGFFAGDFELSDAAQEYLDAWCQGEEDLTKYFQGFGHDGTQSLFAFWLREPKFTLETAPVVFLDGEFEGTRVLAANLKEFVCLLALNVEGLGHVEDWDLGAASRSTKKGPKAFREWLEKTHGLTAPADPQTVVAKARAAHPDLKAWISQRMSAE